MIKEDNDINKKGNSLLMQCIDEILGILLGKNIYYVVNDEFEPLINTESFDNNINFYLRHLRDYLFVEFTKKIDNSEKLNKIIIRNMYVYLNNLKTIITIKEKDNIYLYTDQLIKLDINIIFGYILHELNKRLIQIPDYFLLSIKDIEKRYNFSCINYNTPLDDIWKRDAKKILEKLIETKKTNIDIALIKINEKFLKVEQYEEMDKIQTLQKQLKIDRLKENIQNLEKKYVSNSEYYTFILVINKN